MRLNLVQFQGLGKIDPLSQKLGDDSVIVARDFSQEELKKFSSEAGSLKARFIPCKLLSKRDNSEAQKAKKSGALIAIDGDSLENCSFAAGQKLDLLLNPFTSEKNFLDVQSGHVLCQNGTFIGIVFSDFLRSEGFARSQLLKNAAMSVKVAKRSGAKLLFFSGARSEDEMRASKDLSSFGALLGMKTEDAIKAIKENSKAFMERVK